MGESPMNINRSFAAVAAVSAFAFISFSGPAAAAKPSAKPAVGVITPIRQFIDDFNKGDMAGAKATHVDAPFIIDEPAPHQWSGSGAFDAWAADLVKDAKVNGDTDGKIRLGAVSITHVESDTAYVQIHADYLYREHRKPTVEHGGFTFALAKSGDDWKIAAWAWNGSKPMAEAPAASKVAPTAPKAAPPAKPKI